MNLLERAKQIAHGVEVIKEWLGDGGQVVSQSEAQERADICRAGGPNGTPCPNNFQGFSFATPVALAIKRHLEVKNKLALRVEGEKSLHTCSECGCCIRLLIWQPQSQVQAELTDEEKETLPAHCWKLK